VPDPHGWVYRLLAPSADAAVLQFGDGGAQKWLANVHQATTADRDGATDAQFDLVVMHHSLGGSATLASAIDAAVRRLKPGGRLVLSGANRLRAPDRALTTAQGGVLRATGWGYRRALARAGLSAVALYFAHPPGGLPVYLVSSDRSSARAFFRGASASRHLARWSPRRVASAWLVEINAMPWLQPDLVVVGDKC
jgi:SAM-dependent methyltransferase